MPRGRRVAHSVGVAGFALLLAALFGYGGVCLWFVEHERGLVFQPMQRRSLSPIAAGLKGVAEVTIATADGERLYGWWTPPPAGHGAILVLTGKGVVISDYAGLYRDLAAHGFGVLGIDYRGNGASTGSPSQLGLREDARAAFEFVHAAAPRAKIAVFGASLGTWPAIAVAVDRPAAGVLLNSPYASVRRLFELRGWPLPYRLLMADPLDSAALIGRLHVPVMILHGTADRAIPIAEARRLYEAAHQPKEMIEIAGAAHADVWVGAARQRALAALAQWTAP
ncbi:MAG TPA: alpha/beta fold hydrolase [Stellaceae bacterium]|nr:alpha/beta fold hydrolase [Stellaceae bacterium]